MRYLPTILNKLPKVYNKYTDRSKAALSAINIMRPSKWGNPFVVGKDGTREEVVQKYVRFLSTRPDLVKEAKQELAERNLVCCCSPKLCHGHILVLVANTELSLMDIYHQFGWKGWQGTPPFSPK